MKTFFSKNFLKSNTSLIILQASVQCCDRQINMQSHRDSGRNKSVTNTSEVNNNHCPMTWDGYSCVDATPAGQTVHFQCPGFLKRFSPVLNGIYFPYPISVFDGIFIVYFPTYFLDWCSVLSALSTYELI